MNGLLHNLTHTHTIAGKPGVGEFIICAWRLPNARCLVAFRPDLGDSAGWHPVPDDDDTFTRMLAAAGAHEAMAILRAAAPE
jgi:hypothetical protein